MLSIILPVYREPFLNKTIDSLLSSCVTNIEILVIFDGKNEEIEVKKDPRIRTITIDKVGMRGAINIGLREAKGEYIMKCDAHCAFDNGFDKILIDSCEKDWLVIPRRYSLNEKTWGINKRMLIKDYHYLNFPSESSYGFTMFPMNWYHRGKSRRDVKYNIDETMSFQGSCWLANRNYFMNLVGYLDDKNYSPFGQEQQEIGLKYWLGGGKVMVNKKTWYAHLNKRPHHYNKGLFSRSYKKNNKTIINRTWGALHWLKNEEPKMIHNFSWLVKKFQPIPGWNEDWESELKKVMEEQRVITPLCKIAKKYKTDKCKEIKHPYTPFYYDILKDKNIKKVLELGCSKGASLRMWKEFFPKAQIYGIDIDPRCIFQEDRIKTFLCDETKEDELKELLNKIGTDIDLFIDDGSHRSQDQIKTCELLMSSFKKDVIYIIEDVLFPDRIAKALPKYNVRAAPLKNRRHRDDRILIITHKRDMSFYAKESKYVECSKITGKPHLYSGSSLIRAKQISKYIGAKYNSKEKNKNDICIYVKPSDLSKLKNGDYVDIVDVKEYIDNLRNFPNLKIIVSSQSSYDFLMNLKNKLSNEIILIPQQHCNNERKLRSRKEIKRVGIIGGRSTFTTSLDNVRKKIENIGFEFITKFDYKGKQDVIDFYNTIDIQICWSTRNKVFKNPLKLINAASFGIPTVTCKQIAYKEFDGNYIQVETIDEMINELEKLKDRDYYKKWSEKIIQSTEKYHIDNISKLYKQLT